jgi:hypothetical protein
LEAGKSTNRGAPHQIICQLAILDERNPTTLDSFIVIFIVTEHRLSGERGNGRVVGDRENFGKHAGFIAGGKRARSAPRLTRSRFDAEYILPYEIGEGCGGGVGRKQHRPAVFVGDHGGITQFLQSG